MKEETARASTPRTRVRRLPERARYDRQTIQAILDEGFVCHVGFVENGQPFVVPALYARMGERLVIHGSAASRMLRALAEGAPACVTVTLLDGLVLARSAFHHSLNYRSVVVLGTATEITDPAEKRRALDALLEHVVPGRLPQVRTPSERELRVTRVVALPIDEASAKLRSGPPKDEPADYALDCWAGVLPLRLSTPEPEADPALPAGIEIPPHVRDWRRGRRRC